MRREGAVDEIAQKEEGKVMEMAVKGTGPEDITLDDILDRMLKGIAEMKRDIHDIMKRRGHE